jgi:hypothetical protein
MASHAATAIPTRHGRDQAEARRVARGIMGQLPPELRRDPSPEQWAHIGRGLLRGDEPVDRLVSWMMANGMKATRPLFEMALERGIDAVPDAPQALREFFAHIDARPAWVNDARLDEGARACGIAGLDGMRALLVTGLLAGYQMSAVNRTLLATGTLEKGASRRVAETTKWWFDATSVGGMQRFGAGFKNTIRVRLIHGLVRNHVQLMPDWDADYLGVPVNQTDMQATYLGFSAVFLLGLRLVGVPLTADERDAVMHLWRYIAWVNGVAEDMLHEPVNAQDSATQMLFHNLLSQPMADADSQRLARSLADEPLNRSYPSFKTLRRHAAKSLQLSLARACMDNATLRSLGLPVWQLPWYPLIAIPRNQLVHQLYRLLPDGRERLFRRGRAEQAAILPVLFGDSAPAIKEVGAPHPHGAA